MSWHLTLIVNEKTNMFIEGSFLSVVDCYIHAENIATAFILACIAGGALCASIHSQHE